MCLCVLICSVGDKIASVNGISYTDINHAAAISVLKDIGQTATLVCLLYACFALMMTGGNDVLLHAVTLSLSKRSVSR